ncbi:hypothetical protein FZEAL_6086 [Fusarium zealandicum]|uniref:Uncharacterized protein n=1 Tax=Fusarium zealandicum TaxID=1053134 RepID=A0A8H4UIM1_9HYPO|nr:hypothetical protein FZEAL_6086 [Fusarium zealandicum]
MAIREHFRRALRSDASASAQLEANTPGKITSVLTKSSQTSDKSTSSKSSFTEKLSRTWTWGSKDKDTTKERKPKNNKNKNRKIVHPSEKPLTAQNLEHQEMLSHFTWTFGASSPEQVEGDDFAGVSPCCTRAPSVVDFSLERDSDSDGCCSSSSSSSVKSS